MVAFQLTVDFDPEAAYNSVQMVTSAVEPGKSRATNPKAAKAALVVSEGRNVP